ncbi:MAG: Rpn family recombination-promoting nuclease/putative transposase, partial [Cyanobacteria bacterium]|nr:Rpn family recombination-promoting nuclease/putative transposase [Cyanobacteriota bacterium]MDW8202063.1 Rpn family recombination-promoting nuclease/putative transposase [Cyanobacteriota bacterium SKYGB_h_bin112]
MIDHDRLFKELLTTFFWEFIQLFFPEVAAYMDPDSIIFLDKELFTDVTVGAKYETDLLVQAKFQNHDACFLVHLEHQAQEQPGFDKRMFRYFARLYEKYDLPIYPIALFSYDAPQKPKPPEPSHHCVHFPNKTVLEFHYD